jgi:hypothetical protein
MMPGKTAREAQNTFWPPACYRRHGILLLSPI